MWVLRTREIVVCKGITIVSYLTNLYHLNNSQGHSRSWIVTLKKVVLIVNHISIKYCVWLSTCSCVNYHYRFQALSENESWSKKCQTAHVCTLMERNWKNFCLVLCWCSLPICSFCFVSNQRASELSAMSMHVFLIIPLLLLQGLLVVAIFVFSFKILQLGISHENFISGRNVYQYIRFQYTSDLWQRSDLFLTTRLLIIRIILERGQMGCKLIWHIFMLFDTIDFSGNISHFCGCWWSEGSKINKKTLYKSWWKKGV